MPPQKSQNKSKKNKKTFTYVAPTEEEIKSMQTAARGKATHNSTSTWINALETFRKDIGLPGKIDDGLDSPKGLIRRIFWHNAFELALRAEVISIPADNAVIQDYELYFSKRPPICEDAFYLQPCNNNEVEFTGYWFKSAQMGEKSSILQQNTLSQINSLIYNDTSLSNDKTANSFSSALEIFNESRSPLQQLNSNDLNELNDDQQNQEINGNDETIKKILHGNVFQNCNITFNVNK
ncbi:unnamed protein product [Rhizophagus irregularis]|nr:unnamed protein product [Rhizophagus irregularis]